jgi:hypothetical protein
MSGESARHVWLVEQLIALVEAECREVRNFVLFADRHGYELSQPQTFGGFKPDIFAHDLPSTFRLIAEAKTSNDLDSERSSRQILAFLEHLSLYPRGTFYLGVPWLAQPKAHGLIKRLKRPEHATVTIRVVGFIG